MEKLSHYEFEDEAAQAAFDELMQEFDNISSLENFQRRFNDLFNGPRPLSYQEALELMEEMEQLQEMEQNLLSGQPEKIDPDQLQELIGPGRQPGLSEPPGDAVIIGGSRVFDLPRGPGAIIAQGRAADWPTRPARYLYQSAARPERLTRHPTIVAWPRSKWTKPGPISTATRCTLTWSGRSKKSIQRNTGVPISIQPGDFTIFDTDHTTTTSTVPPARYELVYELGGTLRRGEKSGAGPGEF